MTPAGRRPLVLQLPAHLHEELFDRAGAQLTTAAELGVRLLAKGLAHDVVDQAPQPAPRPVRQLALVAAPVDPEPDRAAADPGGDPRSGGNPHPGGGKPARVPGGDGRGGVAAKVSVAASVAPAAPAEDEREPSARERRTVRGYASVGTTARTIALKTGIPLAVVKKAMR